jgi:DNA invertase Pin-like site-specific DNA recombinase
MLSRNGVVKMGPSLAGIVTSTARAPLQIGEHTKKALAAAKARGVKLGNAPPFMARQDAAGRRNRREYVMAIVVPYACVETV